jgi:1,4-alpha-glucan branching enzyme
MKVLMLTADYPPAVWSGIGVAVALEASALASLGVEVHVLVAAPRRMEPCVTVSGVTEHSLSTRRFPFDPGGFDLVHLHSLALSELALELCRRFSLPLVYTVHSWLPLELGNRAAAAFWCAVQGRVMAASHRVIFLSEADRAEAVKLLPELQEKARRIPNPVPPPGRSRLGPADSGLLVFAGRFVRSKGLACIEGIMERLGAAPHLRLVLAGGHGDAEGERIIDTVLTRFPDSCRVAGWLDRTALDALFACASLVLAPSLYEPFGLVALEAMRMGAPVLASANCAFKEIVTEESGGQLVHSDDPEEWSKAILNLFSHPNDLCELGRKGPGYVAKHFDPARIASRLLAEAYGGRTRGRMMAAS